MSVYFFWFSKNVENELIYKIQTDTYTFESKFWLPKWKGGV